MKGSFLLFVLLLGASAICRAHVRVDSTAPAQLIPPKLSKRIAQDLPLHGRLRFQSKEVYTPAHYTSKLGVICQQELKLDQRTPIALRLRLGSVEACDFLEGKRRGQ